MLQHELLKLFICTHDFDVLIENFVLCLKSFPLHESHLFLDAFNEVVHARQDAFFMEQATLFRIQSVILVVLKDFFLGFCVRVARSIFRPVRLCMLDG